MQMDKRFKHLDERIFGISPTLKAKELAERYGYLPYMIQRYYEMLGDWQEVVLLLEGNEERILPSIRCNTLKIRCKTLEERLSSKNIKIRKIPWAPHGYWVEHSDISIGALHEYLHGYYYIQGPASMIPAYILGPTEKELVIDLAAAPGGKTTQLAQLMSNNGTIIAVERNRKRVKSLISNVRRMGVTNTIILNTDARKLRLYLKEVFDKTLLDAPCTGEGLIPLIPERKRSRTMNDLKILHRLQVELLLTAIELTRDNGLIVYTTCSIAPEENEYVLYKVLNTVDNIELLPISIDIGVPGLDEYLGINMGSEMKLTRRLYTYLTGTEGFFIALLRKR